MKKPLDLAKRFLELAERDAKAFDVLLKDKKIDDSVIGFHAQQTVEKALKAILTLHQIEFRKTHDIGELLQIFEEHDLDMPPHHKTIDELNPYAVSLRYDFFEEEEKVVLDRKKTKQLMDSILDWAKKLCKK